MMYCFDPGSAIEWISQFLKETCCLFFPNPKGSAQGELKWVHFIFDQQEYAF